MSMADWISPAEPAGLTDDERETVAEALEAGFLRADGQRVAVLAAFRDRCRAAGRPVLFILAGRLFVEGADVAAVEGMALELLGCRVKSRQGRLVITAPDPAAVAREIAGRSRGGLFEGAGS